MTTKSTKTKPQKAQHLNDNPSLMLLVPLCGLVLWLFVANFAGCYTARRPSIINYSLGYPVTVCVRVFEVAVVLLPNTTAIRFSLSPKFLEDVCEKILCITNDGDPVCSDVDAADGASSKRCGAATPSRD